MIQEQAGSPAARNDPRVLLVDDAAIRNALRGLLEDAGVEVVGEAPDGTQGVAIYETEESAEAVMAAGAFALPPKHCGADRIRETVVAAWRSGAGDTA
jgi:CheY-like chemotaxis protein